MSTFIDVLRLTFEELTESTSTCYQIKQVQSYTEKHLREDSSYELFLHRGTESVLSIEIQSRNTSTSLKISGLNDTRNPINS